MKALEALADSALGGALSNLSRCFDIAEEVLAEAGDPPGAFGVLAPPKLLRGLAPWIYRAHVSELVERVRAGEDTRPGTEAEALAYLLAGSLAGPPGQDYRAAVGLLWRRLAPEPQKAWADDFADEYAPGAAEELVERAKGLAGDEGRVAR